MDVISTPNAPRAIGPYSQAIRAGDYLFCSGQIALSPDNGELVGNDVGEQTKQVMENLRGVIEAAGGDFSKVVKTTIYLTDMNAFPQVNEVYGASFAKNPPARATVGVASLPKGALVEIEAVVFLG